MKRQVVSSNWRDDLSEYVDISNVSPKKAKTDTKSREKVEEKEVNNKVVINPPMTEAFEELGGTIISVTEELSKEEMEELQRKKDKEQGRKPGKVEEDVDSLMVKRAKIETQGVMNDRRIATIDGKIAKQRKADAKNGNGAIFIGLDSPVVKSHGGTDYIGFSNSLDVCHRIVKGNLIEKIKQNI